MSVQDKGKKTKEQRHDSVSETTEGYTTDKLLSHTNQSRKRLKTKQSTSREDVCTRYFPNQIGTDLTDWFTSYRPIFVKHPMSTRFWRYTLNYGTSVLWTTANPLPIWFLQICFFWKNRVLGDPTFPGENRKKKTRVKERKNRSKRLAKDS